MIEAAPRVHVAPALRRYIVDLVEATRRHADIFLGASPRASIMLLRAARALAAATSATTSIPDDVKSLVVPALAHRVIVVGRRRDVGTHARDVPPRAPGAGRGAGHGEPLMLTRRGVSRRSRASRCGSSHASSARRASRWPGSAWPPCPFLAPFTRAGDTTRTIAVRRRLRRSGSRPARGCASTLEVENLAVAPAPMLLLEDALPTALGRPARLVLTDLRGRGRREVSYPLLPQTRGVYRRRSAHDRRDRRVRRDAPAAAASTARRADRHAGGGGPAAPRRTPPAAVGFGEARARQLLRSGDDYFTMRAVPGGRRPAEDPLALGRADRRADDPPGRGLAPRAGAALPGQPRGGAGTRAHARRSSAPCPPRRASASLLARRRVHDHARHLRAHAGRLRRRTPSSTRSPASRRRAVASLATRSPRSAARRGRQLARVRRRAAGQPGAPRARARELPASARASRSSSTPVDPAAAPPSRREQLHARAAHASPARAARAAGIAWSCPLHEALTERWHRPREHRLAFSA